MARDVPCAVPLEALTDAAADKRIYLYSGDTHPDARGYRVIAVLVG